MIDKKYHMTRKDGVKIYRHFSTEGYKIRKVGTDEIYDEAIDIEGAPYEYEEIDEKIETIEEPSISKIGEHL